MSCVNEQRFGPLHLLARESGGSATGSRQAANELWSRIVTDMWQRCREKISVCS